jgi:hypothetical protein
MMYFSILLAMVDGVTRLCVKSINPSGGIDPDVISTSLRIGSSVYACEAGAAR